MTTRLTGRLPPVSHLETCLADLEDFLRVDADSLAMMALPRPMAVAHVPFEAIRRFSAGTAKRTRK